MDDAFTPALANWTAFYAFAGGAAATLLGLLFVAASLRLDLFRPRDVSSGVRDFAAFTFLSFLSALAVAGLALAPHRHRWTLALPLPPLLPLGIAGLALVIYLVRVWMRLNPRSASPRSGLNPGQWQGWAYIAWLAAPFAGLVAAAILLWDVRSGELVVLAAVEGLLLVMSTMSAWLMLARTGRNQDGETPGTGRV